MHVGKQKGLKRNSGLNFTGLSKVCGHDFEVKPIDSDGNCFFRMISYLLLGVEDKHDIIRASIVEYIVNPDNLARLRSYIPQEFSTGDEYVKATQMNLLTTWAAEVKLLCLCTAVWEGCCLLFWQTVAEIPCKWEPEETNKECILHCKLLWTTPHCCGWNEVIHGSTPLTTCTLMHGCTLTLPSFFTRIYVTFIFPMDGSLKVYLQFVHSSVLRVYIYV